jgi:predicted alpha/beta hydrolase family esterase
MDQTTALALVVAASLGIAAIVLILRRQRKDVEGASKESPFAASTEGEKRCPSCGMGNLVTSDRCASCGAKLPG